jgi:small ubiquitin-related modifier|tara:strand:- start:329 stop:541 length:213 start_codon:yes stop_codon:yes gene_type:complete
VKTFRGDIVFKVEPQVRLSKVIKVVGEKLQKERKHFRMMYEGSRVDDEDTIESLDAYDGDIFEVHEEQCG